MTTIAPPPPVPRCPQSTRVSSAQATNRLPVLNLKVTSFCGSAASAVRSFGGQRNNFFIFLFGFENPVWSEDDVVSRQHIIQKEINQALSLSLTNRLKRSMQSELFRNADYCHLLDWSGRTTLTSPRRRQVPRLCMTSSARSE